MTTPKFSNDPEQQAEMAAQWHFENRLLGINPYRDDYDDADEPGEDYGPDEEEEEDGQPDEAQEWHDFDPDC